MFLCFKLATSLSLFISLSNLCTAENSPFLHAITLGPSRILASVVEQSGNVTVSRYPTRDNYTLYFEDALFHHEVRSNRREDNQEVFVTIVSDEVKRLSQDLRATSAYDPVFAALYVPLVFNESSVFAASKAVFPKGRFGKDGFKRLGYVASAASFAYDLHRCENLGRTPAECELFESINLVLVVEYEKEYLHLHLVEVDPESPAFPSVHDELAKDFGEQSGNDIRKEIGTKEYSTELTKFFNNFIEKALKMPYEREQIRAIVLVGEASELAFAKIQEIAYKAVGNQEVKVLNKIAPALVVAHGAAMYARDTLGQRPFAGCTSVQDEHDEL